MWRNEHPRTSYSDSSPRGVAVGASSEYPVPNNSSELFKRKDPEASTSLLDEAIALASRNQGPKAPQNFGVISHSDSSLTTSSRTFSADYYMKTQRKIDAMRAKSGISKGALGGKAPQTQRTWSEVVEDAEVFGCGDDNDMNEQEYPAKQNVTAQHEREEKKWEHKNYRNVEAPVENSRKKSGYVPQRNRGRIAHIKNEDQFLSGMHNGRNRHGKAKFKNQFSENDRMPSKSPSPTRNKNPTRKKKSALPSVALRQTRSNALREKELERKKKSELPNVMSRQTRSSALRDQELERKKKRLLSLQASRPKPMRVTPKTPNYDFARMSPLPSLPEDIFDGSDGGTTRRRKGSPVRHQENRTGRKSTSPRRIEGQHRDDFLPQRGRNTVSNQRRQHERKEVGISRHGEPLGTTSTQQRKPIKRDRKHNNSAEYSSHQRNSIMANKRQPNGKLLASKQSIPKRYNNKHFEDVEAERNLRRNDFVQKVEQKEDNESARVESIPPGRDNAPATNTQRVEEDGIRKIVEIPNHEFGSVPRHINKDHDDSVSEVSNSFKRDLSHQSGIEEIKNVQTKRAVITMNSLQNDVQEGAYKNEVESGLIQKKADKDGTRTVSEVNDNVAIPKYVEDNLDQTMSEMSYSFQRDSSRRSTITAQLDSCLWESMYHKLNVLEQKPEQALEALLMNGSDAFHMTAWKSPPALAVKFFNILTPNEYDMLRAVDGDGNTPLHLCCANLIPPNTDSNATPKADFSTLRSLLDRVPDSLEIQNNEGDTPLHLLLSSPLVSNIAGMHSMGYDDIATEAVELITEHIPSYECFLLKDSSGATPLHVAISNEACDSILIHLIATAPDACKAEDTNGMVPLHYVAAFLSTSPSVVESMISKYSYSVCHKTHDGDTPLHLLMRNSVGATMHAEILQIAKILIGNGNATREEKELNADYCPMLLQNREQLNPVHCFALFNAPVEIGQLLIRTPSSAKATKMINAHGSTPLHIAVAHKNPLVSTIQVLATTGSAMAQDKLRRTPLHIASQNAYSSVEVIKWLVSVNPLACNQQSDGGYLPIHLAVHSQAKLDIVTELIESFPSSVEKESVLGDTPLHKAAINNVPFEVFEYLLKEYKGAVYKPNQLGDLPLHCAVSNESNGQIIKSLVKEWPQAVATQNREGNCPLHVLVKSSADIDLIEFVINAAKSSVLLLNAEGKIPIDMARRYNVSTDVVSLLEIASEEWTKQAVDGGWSSFEDLR